MGGDSTGDNEQERDTGTRPQPEPKPPKIVVDTEIQGTATKGDKPHETRG